MAEAIPADYLVTGDKDLLVLIRQGKYRIITFSEFLNFISPGSHTNIQNLYFPKVSRIKKGGFSGP